MRVEAHDHRDAGRARSGHGLARVRAQPRSLVDELRREAAGQLALCDELEHAQRGDEHDPPLGHAVEHSGRAVQRLAVLDRVHAGVDGELDAGQALGM